MGHEGHECGCGHDHGQEPEYTAEDLAYSAHNRMDALIDLLIEKKIITEKEYEQKIEEIVEKDLDGLDDADDSDDESDEE